MDAPVPSHSYDQRNLHPPEELTLIPFSFEEKDEFRGSHNNNIHIYCKDRLSRTYMCRVTNFPCYSCLELDEHSYNAFIPDGLTFRDTKYIPSDNFIYWDSSLAGDLADKISKKLKDKGLNVPICHMFENYEEIYYYSKGRKKPYLYLFFHSNKDKKKFKDLCTRYPTFLNAEYQYVKFKIHEEKISSLMRLMSKRNLKYNQWFSVVGFRVPWGSDYRVSNGNINEFYIDYETMNPIDPSLTSSWHIYMRLAGFDFEVFGHKGVKRFVSSMEIKDPIFMISVDFKILGKENTRKKYCLVYGDSYDVEASEIYRFKTEQDMMVAFSHLIIYLDPDIILTYNGNMFDYPYLLNRYAIHHIPDSSIPTFGRLLNVPTEIYSENWKSSGAGRNDNTFIIAPGRIVIDLYPTIKRYYKLRMYSLEYVSNEYLSTANNEVGKRKITVAQMFDAFASYHANPNPSNVDGITKMTTIADYCIQDSALCIDLYENRQLWYHLYSLSGEGGVSIADIVYRGEQCRCYSQLYNLCHKNGRVLSNSKLFDYYYTGGYVGNPIRRVFKYCFTLDFTSLYPSIMQAYNLCYTTFIPIWMWPEVPVECCEVIPVEQWEPTEHYSISRRNDIKEKMKLQNSGFPVTITDEEIEYYQRGMVKTTTESLDSENPEEKIEFDVEDLSNLPEKTLRKYEFRFIKQKYFEGFMPKLERCWVASRKIVKKEIEVLKEELDECDSEFKILSSKEVLKYVDKQLEIRRKLEVLEDQGLELLLQSDYVAISKQTTFDSSGNIIESSEMQDEIEKLKAENKKFHDDQEKRLKEIKVLGEELVTIEKYLILFADDSSYQMKLDEIRIRIDVIRIELIVKDKTQNAIKIIANSGYGFTGVRTGMLSGVFIAICVTYIGRKLVNQANDVLVEEFKHLGAVVVYNDTDSSMIGLDIDESYDCEDIGKQMQDVICGRPEIKNEAGDITQTKIEPVFKAPLMMEFEDVCQMCPIKPKFYLKAKRETNKKKIEKNGPFKLDKKGNIDITKKGVLTAKRGNSKFAMMVYDDLSKKVLFLDNILNSLHSLADFCAQLLNDKFEAKNLAKVTELGSDYKEENYYMNVFAKNLIMWGKPVKPGDRLEYIIVKTQEELATGKEISVGMKCRELTMWQENPNREIIDYEYYIEKGLQTQYDDLFDVGYHDITSDKRFEYVGYQPQFSRCHFVHFKEPVRMITAMVKDYFKASDYDFAKLLWEKCNNTPYYPQQYHRNFYISSLVTWEISKINQYLDSILCIIPKDSVQ
jgi:DNA polymerase elongation subunit (family B)